jgi:hypothetical protein
MALAEREAAPRSWRSGWAIVIGLLTAAIVITHHLTSYALAAILTLLAVLYAVMRKERHWPNPWPFALLALGLAAAWLLGVAGATIHYLSPVLTRAFESALHTVTGESGARALFQGSGTNSAGTGPTAATTPALARAIALGSIGVLLIGLPFGLLQVWRRHRSQPFALLFCAGAAGFFGILGLRLAPEAWETSNRASDFVFIGLAFVLAFAFVLAYERLKRRGPRFAPWLSRAVIVASFPIILIGGAISGWPWDSQLAPALRATRDGRTIDSEPLAMAEWVGDHLRGRRFAATIADSRMLLAPGGVRVRSGRNPDIEDFLEQPTFIKGDCVRNCETGPNKSFGLPILHTLRLRYVVADRRSQSGDLLRGYAFSVRPPGGARDQLLPVSSVNKFGRIRPATRIFDSGKIVIFDLRGRR